MLTISSIAVSTLPMQGPATARVQPLTPVRSGDSVALRSQGVTAPVLPVGVAAAAVQGVGAPPALPPVNPAETVLRSHMFDNAAAPERFQFSTAERVAAQALGGGVAVPAQAAHPDEAVQGLPGQGSGAPQAVEQRQAQEQREAQQRREAEEQQQAEEQRLAQEQQLAEEQQQDLQEAQVRRGAAGEPVPGQAQGQQPPDRLDEALAARVRDLLPNMWSASRFAVDMLIGEEAREARAARAEYIAPLPPSPLERALEAAAQTYQRASGLSDSGVGGRGAWTA